jgi:hypothetical protein
MARIASFSTNDGDRVTEEVDTFDWHGLEVRLNPEFSELDLVDFMEEASQVDEKDPRSIGIVKKILQAQVHPDDFQAFWDHTKKVIRPGKQLEALMLASNQLISGATGRPTERPSDSSSGPVATVTSLRGDSSSPESPLSGMDRRVMDRYQGRADIQELILRNAERRSEEQRQG